MDEDKLKDIQRRRPLIRVGLADLDWALGQVVILRADADLQSELERLRRELRECEKVMVKIVDDGVFLGMLSRNQMLLERISAIRKVVGE